MLEWHLETNLAVILFASIFLREDQDGLFHGSKKKDEMGGVEIHFSYTSIQSLGVQTSFFGPIEL